MNDELSSDYSSPEKKLLSGELEKKLLSGELDLIKEINDVTPQKLTVDKDTHLHSLTEKVNDFKKCLGDVDFYFIEKVPKKKFKSILDDNVILKYFTLK